LSTLYLDASAITKLVISESETAELQADVSKQALITSRVAVVEVGKAVARSNPDADAQPVLSRFAFVEIDAELAQLAAATGTPELRSLDAIHLASALQLGGVVAAFVTYDDRQAAAARELGFSVRSPGQGSRTQG